MRGPVCATPVKRASGRDSPTAWYVSPLDDRNAFGCVKPCQFTPILNAFREPHEVLARVLEDRDKLEATLKKFNVIKDVESEAESEVRTFSPLKRKIMVARRSLL